MARVARTYGRVERDLWRSPDFRALSAPKPNAQTLWLHLLSSARTTVIPGVIKATPGVIADDLGWSRRALDRCLLEITSRGMAEVDPAAELVVLTKAILVDGKLRDSAHPGSLNAAKSWATTLSKIIPCRLRNLIAMRLVIAMEQIGGQFPSVFAEAMTEACGKAYVSDAHGKAQAVCTQGSGIRDQGSGSVCTARAGEGSVLAQGAESGLRPVAGPSLAEHACDRLNAARRALDPTAPALDPIRDPQGTRELADRLRDTPTDERAVTLDRALDVFLAAAAAEGWPIDRLRLGWFAGPRNWVRWRDGTVAGVSVSARGRDGPGGRRHDHTGPARLSTAVPVDGEQIP